MVEPQPGIYGFDDADAQLTLLPMAARRALDVARRHLSLQAWQQLTLPQRQALVQLGAAEQVDAPAVVRWLHGTAQPMTEADAWVEPPAHAVPTVVQSALGSARTLTAAQWQALRALDRYVLSKLAQRGRQERLLRAYDEIL